MLRSLVGSEMCIRDSMCAVSVRCFHARCFSRYLFFPGPPWPLFLSWPSLASDCTSSVSVLLPSDLAPCKFSFVSLFRLRSFSFSCFRLPWLLLISSPLLFPCGGLGLLVPELMVLCCLLSPLLFLHSSLAVILSSLVLCWAYVTFGARALVVLPHFQFVFALVVIGSCF